MTDEKLKPCPFCGGEAVIFKYYWQVRCEECMAETSIFETREQCLKSMEQEGEG